MDESPDTAEERDGSREQTDDDDMAPFELRRSENSTELRLTVVEREIRSDRGTVHPPGLTGLERMETWLSADTSAFVELAAWR